MSRSKGSDRSKESPRNVTWMKRYGAVVRHQARTGSMPHEFASPTGDKEREEENKMAGWVRFQRRRADRGVMPVWERELLEQLPGFSWDPLGEQWDRWCGLLNTFLITEGRMPRYRSLSPSEKALAAWVHKQRHLFRAGSLSVERVASLRSLPYKIV